MTTPWSGLLRRLTGSRRHSADAFTPVETIVFLGPLLFFLAVLFFTLGWTIYVSFTNWSTSAPNYTFTGIKWYQFLAGDDRFWVDVQNNLKWLIIGVVPTVILAILLAYVLELFPIRGVESYVRILIL